MPESALQKMPYLNCLICIINILQFFILAAPLISATMGDFFVVKTALVDEIFFLCPHFSFSMSKHHMGGARIVQIVLPFAAVITSWLHLYSTPSILDYWQHFLEDEACLSSILTFNVNRFNAFMWVRCIWWKCLVLNEQVVILHSYCINFIGSCFSYLSFLAHTLWQLCSVCRTAFK